MNTSILQSTFSPPALFGSGRSIFSEVLGLQAEESSCWQFDQAKAFDGFNHEYLWLLLGKYGLEGGLYRLAEDLIQRG